MVSLSPSSVHKKISLGNLVLLIFFLKQWTLPEMCPNQTCEWNQISLINLSRVHYLPMVFICFIFSRHQIFLLKFFSSAYCSCLIITHPKPLNALEVLTVQRIPVLKHCLRGEKLCLCRSYFLLSIL